MKNVEFYILIATGFSILLSWVTSRFGDLSIGLFNTAIGLIFGVTAELTTNSEHAIASVQNPAPIDYVLLLTLCQFAFGILVVSSHFASERIRKAQASTSKSISIGPVPRRWCSILA
jgi:hypothetical protein